VEENSRKNFAPIDVLFVPVVAAIAIVGLVATDIVYKTTWGNFGGM
jgi:hypothetical protein